MIELLLPYGFDTLEHSWVKATIGICTLADYSVAKKHQQYLLRVICSCDFVQRYHLRKNLPPSRGLDSEICACKLTKKCHLAFMH
jgi:hypothetical protein